MNRISAVALLLLVLGPLSLTGCAKPEWPDVVLDFYSNSTNENSSSATIQRPNELVTFDEDTAYALINAAFREQNGNYVISEMVVETTLEDGFEYVDRQEVTGQPMQVKISLRNADGTLIDHDGNGQGDQRIHCTVTFTATLDGPYYPVTIGKAQMSFTLVAAETMNDKEWQQYQLQEDKKELMWKVDWGGNTVAPRTPFTEMYFGMQFNPVEDPEL